MLIIGHVRGSWLTASAEGWVHGDIGMVETVGKAKLGARFESRRFRLPCSLLRTTDCLAAHLVANFYESNGSRPNMYVHLNIHWSPSTLCLWFIPLGGVNRRILNRQHRT